MLAQLARGIGSLLFPAACPGCRQPVENPGREPLCPSCLGLLPRCASSWSPAFGPVDGAVSPFLYEGACREMLLALKYRGRISLVPFLAGHMAREILLRPGTGPADLIIPVPLHPSRFRERSYNQAELLGRALSRRLQLSCEEGLLIRCRPTLPQADLTRQERAANVRGAFDLHGGFPFRGRRILLVDDVLTTGATAAACAKLLKSAGAKSVTAVTAARD